jgi:hypothetical protein
LQITKSSEHRAEKKISYGGGGIVPDLFIPLPTRARQREFSLYESAFVGNFVFLSK